MISKPLLKRNLTGAFKLSLIFIGILFMYTAIIIYMYSPDFAKMLSGFQEMMPEFMGMFGMSGGYTNLTEFMHTFLYGFIMMLFPIIFIIVIINKLLVKYVDDGSLACLLATPNSRTRIIFTQIISTLISIAFVIIVTTLIGITCSQLMFPGELDVSKYLQLNLSILLLHFALAGIAFVAACIFNDSKNYFFYGAGIPLIFYMIQMISNMGGKMENLKYATIFTLFPGASIINGEGGVLSSNLILAGITLLCFSFGGYYFTKKDLSL